MRRGSATLDTLGSTGQRSTWCSVDGAPRHLFHNGVIVRKHEISQFIQLGWLHVGSIWRARHRARRCKPGTLACDQGSVGSRLWSPVRRLPRLFEYTPNRLTTCGTRILWRCERIKRRRMWSGSRTAIEQTRIDDKGALVAPKSIVDDLSEF